MSAHAGGPYSVIDLGDLPGGLSVSQAFGLSENGYVAGTSIAGTGGRGFIWDSVNGMRDLGDLPGGTNQSRAFRVNAHGQVVGDSVSSVGQQPFIWDSVNGMQNLGGLPGGTGVGFGTGINDLGYAVGASSVALSSSHAFLWVPGTAMIDIGATFPGCIQSFPTDINKNISVVGSCSTANGVRAFVWSFTEGVQLLGGLPGGNGYSSALAMNDVGQVVGVSNTANGNRAFIWDQAHGMNMLPILPGGTGENQATGVNNLGQVVGLSSSGVSQPFLWERETGMRSLNDLLLPAFANWNITEAWSINDRGWIAGTGISPTGQRHAVLLTPEPASIAMLMTMAVVAFRRRRV